MNKAMNWGAALLMMLAMGLAAAAEKVTETRPVDARVVRVKLDGVISLQVQQGATPSLTLSGEQKYLARTTTRQNGDTLAIETEFNDHGHIDAKTVRVILTLPNLREVVSDSVGSTEVRGFSGKELVLGLEGAGAIKVDCNYKVLFANLGGVGSMNIQNGDSDSVNLDLRGAGYITLAGKTKWLKANLGGLGGLDAKAFDAENVNIDLSGLGNATVLARQSADLNLSGMGSVTVFGKPLSRKVSVDGLGKVSWK